MTSSSYSFQSTHPTGRVLGKNYSPFLDFTRNYVRTSGILSPDMHVCNCVMGATPMYTNLNCFKLVKTQRDLTQAESNIILRCFSLTFRLLSRVTFFIINLFHLIIRLLINISF